MGEMMRAMVLDSFGGPEVLHMAEIERPRAAPGNVIVQVAYASVNPADWKAREGWLARYFEYQFPFVVGFDAAGIVAEVGEGVTELKVGDRVVTASNQGLGERGSYAEYVASAVERLLRPVLPPGSTGTSQIFPLWEGFQPVSGTTSLTGSSTGLSATGSW